MLQPIELSAAAGLRATHILRAFQSGPSDTNWARVVSYLFAARPKKAAHSGLAFLKHPSELPVISHVYG